MDNEMDIGTQPYALEREEGQAVPRGRRTAVVALARRLGGEGRPGTHARGRGHRGRERLVASRRGARHGVGGRPRSAHKLVEEERSPRTSENLWDQKKSFDGKE